jgi:hypothetical protein
MVRASTAEGLGRGQLHRTERPPPWLRRTSLAVPLDAPISGRHPHPLPTTADLDGDARDLFVAAA